MNTSFYVELPADEYGNTAMKTAVVEARIEVKYGREMLVPVAPDHFVQKHPTGWYRDIFGGWAEVDGPARLLSYEEHKELVASLDESKLKTKNGLVRLRTGDLVPQVAVNVVRASLNRLFESDPIGFYEIVMICRNRNHQLFGDYGNRLSDFGLIEPNGQPHDLTRQIVLAATEGDDLDMELVNPISTE